MKKLSSLILSFVVFVSLCSCSSHKISPEVNSPESLAHKEMFSKLVSLQYVCGKPMSDGKVVCRKKATARKKAVGTSWKGKWLFTVINKDRTLEEGTAIAKAELDNSNNSIYAGEKIDPKTLTKDQVVYVGFTSLDDGVGFEVITNNKNTKMPLTSIKVEGNKLQWVLNYEGNNGSKLFTQTRIFKTNAIYNPAKDKLAGETEFGMTYKVSGDGKNVKEKTVYIPMGKYVWHASRISEYSFRTLTKPGEYRTDIPQYVIGLDTNSPKISKLLFNK